MPTPTPNRPLPLLRHGPYRSPKVAPGAQLTSVLGDPVTVRRITTAPIPWPVDQHQHLVAVGDLVIALARESERSLCAWWNIQPAEVRRLRRQLGLMNPRPPQRPGPPGDDLTYTGQAVIAALLQCWPLPLERVAHMIGTDEIELGAFVHRTRPLSAALVRRLDQLLGLHHPQGVADSDGPAPVPRCGYALLASDARTAVARAYAWLIHDAAPGLSIEAIPQDPAMADRQWRLLLCTARGAFRPNLIVFPREGPSAGLLDTDQLPGYAGPLAVDDNTYLLLVRMWEEVMHAPARANRVFPRPVARALHAHLLALPDRALRASLQPMGQFGWPAHG